MIAMSSRISTPEHHNIKIEIQVNSMIANVFMVDVRI